MLLSARIVPAAVWREACRVLRRRRAWEDMRRVLDAGRVLVEPQVMPACLFFPADHRTWLRVSESDGADALLYAIGAR